MCFATFFRWVFVHIFVTAENVFLFRLEISVMLYFNIFENHLQGQRNIQTRADLMNVSTEIKIAFLKWQRKSKNKLTSIQIAWVVLNSFRLYLSCYKINCLEEIVRDVVSFIPLRIEFNFSSLIFSCSPTAKSNF